MLRTLAFSSLISALLAMAVSAGLTVVLAQDSSSPNETRAAVAPGFAYQGRVEIDGVPAEGSFDFIFRLFDQESNGTQVGPDVTMNGLIVSNGVFTTTLDFGPGAIEGSERFVDVQVRPTGGGAFAALLPRHALAPAPYALFSLETAAHDHVGETWIQASFGKATALELRSHQTGVVGVNGVSLVFGYAPAGVQGVSEANTGVYGNSITGNGVEAVSQGRGQFGAGIRGVSIGQGCTGADPSTSCPIGIYGGGNLAGGIGVYGRGVSTGVRGEPFDANGVGVVGDGLALGNGVVGRSSAPGYAATFGENALGYGLYGSGSTGVYGVSNAGIGVQGVGVTGIHGSSSSGDGVYGTSTNNGFAGVHGVHTTWNGVYGQATSGTGVQGYATSGVGVYGTSDTGFAGFFQGKVWVTGIVDAPSGQLRAVAIKPDLDNSRNLGFGGLAWKQVVSYSFANASDARLKHDIQDLSSGLAETLALRPVSFAWNSDGHADIGLIAQEVQKVFPEIVATGEDEQGTLTVDYTRLVPVLIRAIQEQQSQMDALRSELADLSEKAVR